MREETVLFGVARAGFPFIAPAFVLTIIALAMGWWVAAAVLAILTGYLAFFFRDPDRKPPQGEDVAVSPADGTVYYVDEVPHEGFPEGRAKRVGIMLTVFNVHVNRAPLAGRIRAIDYKPGKFHNALYEKSSAENEHNRIGFDTTFGYMEVRQIAGLIARRIVCYKRQGDSVARAGRIGLIRFGSRTEAYLPVGTEIWVRKGSRVSAGVTPLGRVGEGAKPS